MEVKDFNEIGMCEELGRRFKYYRVQSGITQEELADKSLVSVSTITRFESGKDIGLIKLIRLLKGLNLDNNLEVLIPDVTIQPVYVIEPKKRARKKNCEHRSDWKWGDEL